MTAIEIVALAAVLAACLGAGWLSYRLRFKALLADLKRHLDEESATKEPHP